MRKVRCRVKTQVMEVERGRDRVIVEPHDAVMIRLFGSAANQDGVHLTREQLEGLAEWAGFTTAGWHGKDKPTHPDDEEERDKISLAKFMAAADQTTLLRLAEQHGLRIMAFLAGRQLLRPGDDPVEQVAMMLEPGLLQEPFSTEEEEEEEV